MSVVSPARSLRGTGKGGNSGKIIRMLWRIKPAVVKLWCYGSAVGEDFPKVLATPCIYLVNGVLGSFLDCKGSGFYAATA
ncbi:MAG: hypothetical protein WCK35_17630 [Chloroflexota bacterium]